MYFSFVKYFVLSVLMAFCGFVLFNFFINPFGIYPTSKIKYMNHQKYDDHERMSVAINLIKYKPKVITLGTSRVMSVFDDESLRKISRGETFYNASFPAASFDEIYSYFLHALYLQNDLKTVILGIDLFSFNEKRKPRKNFCEYRLCRNSLTLNDIKDSLFTRKAAFESYTTLRRSWFDESRRNPIIDCGEMEYLRLMLKNNDCYGDYQLGQQKIQKFADMVSTCKDRSIELKVFICPVNAMYWDFYFQNELWHHVEDLKRQLCAIHPLWDFSGFNPITTESLESEANPLYYECSHCTPYTGNLLLQRMYGEPSSIDSVGFLLTPETIESAFIQIRKDHQEWVNKS